MSDTPRRGHATPLDYQRALLDDPVRVEAYARALRELVRPGDVVLDLGAGTGLLAMLAARRGARVHAVESMPIARAARRLVAANGLEDRVSVHEADIVELGPVEPVDLVVGDFMGRFLVDDDMLDAVEAAGRWLRPGGRFCPSRVALQLAPVGGFELPMVERFEADLAGIDLGCVLPLARRSCYVAHLGEAQLLGAPAAYHELTPPRPAAAFDRPVSLALERAGRLSAVAGFFEAQLAPGVALSTRPGISTHWGQMLFPLPACEVRTGDRLDFRLRLARDGAWEWTARLHRGDALVMQADSDSRGDGSLLAEPDGDPRDGGEAAPWRPDRRRAIEASNRGTDAFRNGRLEDALACYQEAARALGPEDDDLAPDIDENLGLAHLNLGHYRRALTPFLCALRGDPTSREQSLRFLVLALYRCGLQPQLTRLLACYEDAFGPHPDGLASGRERTQRDPAR